MYKRQDYDSFDHLISGMNLIGVTMNVISFSGQDDNSITFSTKVNLSVANSMNDIAKSDHVFALADIDSLMLIILLDYWILIWVM